MLLKTLSSQTSLKCADTITQSVMIVCCAEPWALSPEPQKLVVTAPLKSQHSGGKGRRAIKSESFWLSMADERVGVLKI